MNDIKFEDWSVTVFWAAVCIAALIAGFVFGWCWRDRSGALAQVSILNVMTAVGTVGAAISGVGIATFGYLQRKRDELDAATRYARSQADVLLSVHESLRLVLNMPLKESFSDRSVSKIALLQHLSGAMDKLKGLDAERLSLAFPGVGVSMGSAKVFIAQAVAQVEAASDVAPYSPGRPRVPYHQVVNVTRTVSKAKANLENSWNVLLSG